MYTLREVAERWQKTENEVLRMVIDGEITLSVSLSCCQVQAQESGRVSAGGRTVRINDDVGLVPLELKEIKALLSGAESVDVGYFHRPGMTYFPLNDSGDDLELFKVTRERLVVSREELSKYEGPAKTVINAVAPDNLQTLLEGTKDETPDTISTTWQEIESKSGMTRNTFQEWAEKAGVPWKNEGGEVRITLKDILKVKSFRDKTKKEQKKK